MKKFGYYLLYVVVLTLLLYLGSQLYEYLHILKSRTFEPIPLMVFYSLFPIVVGIYLALPEFISRVRKQGRWKVNWIKFFTIGTVSLFFALTPVLYYVTPIGKQAPQLILWLAGFEQGFTISGLVFGYLILTVPEKLG